MKTRFVCGICLMALIMLSIAVPAFSQEKTEEAVPGRVKPVEAAKEGAPAGDLSLYGEVRSVDQAAGSISVQYYDYDSDEEKTTDIAVSSQTKLDGAAALAEIKQNDWVDVIYVASGGKNTAKSIIIEKEEIAQPISDETSEADVEEEY